MSLLKSAYEYYFSKPKPKTPQSINYTDESIENMPPGTRIFRHPSLGKRGELMRSLIPGKHTLPECLEYAVNKYGDKDCLGTRPLIKVHKQIDPKSGKVMSYPELGPVEWMSYNQVYDKITALSSGIANWAPSLNKPGAKFGIYAPTCPQWIMAAYACFKRGLVVATCYANLGEEALIHVVKECELEGMCVTRALVPRLEALRSKLPTLKYLVVIEDEKYNISAESDGDDTEEDAQTESDDSLPPYEISSVDELIEEGKKNHVPVEQKPDKEDPVLIMYTSGSTGLPKGVVVKHINLISAAGGVASLIDADEDYDTYIAYLPLAHILELAIENGLLFMGVKMAYGHPRTLIERGVRNCEGDIAEIKPSILVGVPRVFETIRKGAMEKIATSGAVTKYLFNTAYKYQSQYVKKNQYPSVFWNALVFNKFQKRLGGRMRIIVSGGAALNNETHEFLKTAFNNCAVVQGYGLTETSGAGTVQDFSCYEPGNVGFPVPSGEMRLVDVPELGYYHSDRPNPRGEVWIRGYSVSEGYFKQQDKTREAFTQDGWFKTGDIGELLPDGSLKLIDRKKNLIKLATGEYIALEALEMIYGNSEFVAPNGVCVYADDNHSRPVALMCPNDQFVKRWASQNYLSTDDLTSIYRSDAFHNAVLKDLQYHARKAHKKKFETVRDVYICEEPWSPDNSCLTSAMKLNRNHIYKVYREQIDNMYKKK